MTAGLKSAVMCLALAMATGCGATTGETDTGPRDSGRTDGAGDGTMSMDVVHLDVPTTDTGMEDTGKTTDVVMTTDVPSDSMTTDGGGTDGSLTDGGGCPTGMMVCSGTCVDVASDAANCGMCGHVCNTGEVCSAGACACSTGRTRCGGACVDTTTDNSNCGGCGTSCPAGQMCNMGACSITCAPGRTACMTGTVMSCLDLQTDPLHCGTCATACGAGQTCSAGSCVCGAGQTLCGTVCVNTMNDATNCGGCGIACGAGQACVMGACACPVGRTNCGGTCVDVTTDSNHCGGCATVCPSGTMCSASVCASICSGGTTLCGSTCVNTSTDPTHCGTCATACAAGQICSAGTCGCAMGLTACGTACVNTATDGMNCGGCGVVCPAGQMCTMGACAGAGPVNDTRAGATTIDLSTPAVNLTTNTMTARNDTTGSCGCTSGNDVFFTFTLTATEIVYADTIGAGWDTSLFLQDSTGANITTTTLPGGQTCDDDNGLGCTSGLQSMIAARLAAGTYYLVLSGCGNGAATIHFQHLPVGSGTLNQIMPTTGTQTVMGTTSGTGVITSSCCSGGAENTYWFVTCPSFAAIAFNATTCGLAGYDTELDQRSAGRSPGPSSCNDDSCGLQSNVNSMIPAGAGLHTLYADACTGSGAYSVQIRFGMGCPAGQTLCGTTCVDTTASTSNCGACGTVCASGANSTATCMASTCGLTCTMGFGNCDAMAANGCEVDLSNSSANCGACGNVCAAGTACVAGACVSNDECAGATPVTLLAGTTTVTGSTAMSTHSTTNSCGSGPDVYYRFTLTQREIVYVDTFGSGYDTEVGFVTTCGGAVTGCVDDICSTAQSQTTATFDAGTYYIVVGGFGASSGAYTLHIQHLPVPTGAATATVAMGMSSIAGDTTGAPSFNDGCGVAGATRYYTWLTCPTAPAGTFTASTCMGATYDTVLAERNGDTGAVACNDDSCSLQSTVTATVAAGAGLHVFYSSGYNTATGTFTATVTRP